MPLSSEDPTLFPCSDPVPVLVRENPIGVRLVEVGEEVEGFHSRKHTVNRGKLGRANRGHGMRRSPRKLGQR
jgi:hypothetical protein